MQHNKIMVGEQVDRNCSPNMAHDISTPYVSDETAQRLARRLAPRYGSAYGTWNVTDHAVELFFQTKDLTVRSKVSRR
jgi:hypothetical protein